MSAGSSIEWCDHTFNPWWGCQRVSPGCEHCYAETFAKRLGKDVWGPNAERRFFGDAHWAEPLKWNAAALKAGVRHRVFCASMADVFEDRRDLDDQRARLAGLIRETPCLDWLLLTKRPQNAVRLWAAAWATSWNGSDSLGFEWSPNIWLGVTAEDQQRGDERIPVLMEIPAAVRFVSYEPAIGPLDLRRWSLAEHGRWAIGAKRGLFWVIVGGESGAGARAHDLEWTRRVIEQCRSADIACFVKQFGANPFDSSHRLAVGSDLLFRLRDRKGGDLSELPGEWPREFPL